MMKKTQLIEETEALQEKMAGLECAQATRLSAEQTDRRVRWEAGQ
jgi:hypothetical protein